MIRERTANIGEGEKFHSANGRRDSCRCTHWRDSCIKNINKRFARFARIFIYNFGNELSVVFMQAMLIDRLSVLFFCSFSFFLYGHTREFFRIHADREGEAINDQSWNFLMKERETIALTV